jgi:hypothetical protein
MSAETSALSNEGALAKKRLFLDDMQAIDTYWRAANSLSVGQIYLCGNLLLREPLTRAHIKPVIVGHGGSAPGQNCNPANGFRHLHMQGVLLEGMVLTPNMALPGNSFPGQPSAEELAEATLRCLSRAVPAAVSGIAFLSGGKSLELASARLNAINAKSRRQAPWPLTFSFARAIQQPALAIWGGRAENLVSAQMSLDCRARLNRAARQGDYDPAMEVAA